MRPGGVGSHDITVEASTDRETQAVTERKAVSGFPNACRSFGVCCGYRFNIEPQSHERVSQRWPVDSLFLHLSREFGPVSRADDSLRPDGVANHVCASFTQKPREQSGRVENDRLRHLA